MKRDDGAGQSPTIRSAFAAGVHVEIGLVFQMAHWMKVGELGPSEPASAHALALAGRARIANAYAVRPARIPAAFAPICDEAVATSERNGLKLKPTRVFS